jgi:N6-adenosine-specific RNA methylase IME4
VTTEIDLSIAAISKTALELPSEMSFDDWAEYGARLSRISEGVMWWIGDWWRYGEARYGERAAQALESGNYAFQTYADAGWVAGKIGTSRRREVLSWSHHKEVAALDPEVADVLLDDAIAHEWSRNDLRKQVREHRRAERVKSIVREHEQNPAALGAFPVLYADPPWRYDFAEDEESRAVENHYPTMTVEEISELEVPGAADGVLFLWATSPKLREALAVVDAWGYEYRTCMVWVKDRIGMGYYARQQHELLLIGVRGDIPTPAPADRPGSVIAAPRGEHSAKPDRAYELIEQMYPEYGKCELFQRRPRDGWIGWGNQI